MLQRYFLNDEILKKVEYQKFVFVCVCYITSIVNLQAAFSFLHFVVHVHFLVPVVEVKLGAIIPHPKTRLCTDGHEHS